MPTYWVDALRPLVIPQPILQVGSHSYCSKTVIFVKPRNWLFFIKVYGFDSAHLSRHNPGVVTGYRFKQMPRPRQWLLAPFTGNLPFIQYWLPSAHVAPHQSPMAWPARKRQGFSRCSIQPLSFKYPAAVVFIQPLSF
jgi:hypothetical protein